MNLQQIQDLAGHRDVPAWVIKLVQDAVSEEREACARVVDANARQCGVAVRLILESNAAAIRARSKA
jgi:hypothetical protein